MKDQIKSEFLRIRAQYHWARAEKNIRKMRKVSNMPVKKMTAEEKAEIKRYWKDLGFPLRSLAGHRYLYDLTGKMDVRYVSESQYLIKIRPCLNNEHLAIAWMDKAYLSKILEGLPTPIQIVGNADGVFLDGDCNTITRKEAEKLVAGHNEIVIKPTLDTGEGKNVRFFSEPFSVSELFDMYDRDFTVQVPIKQHKDMSALNPSSVNTIRALSLFWENRVTVLGVFLRIGGEGSFTDNSGTRRSYVGIGTDGSLNRIGYNFNRQPTDKTAAGILFEGAQVPGYEKIGPLLEKAHRHFARFRLVFWDVCIDEDGEPLIIEANLVDSPCTMMQIINGPLFGDMTEEVLKNVRKRKIWQ